jgi:predicted nucleic acid-binding protein
VNGVFVDTSGWFALVDRDERRHEQVKALFLRHRTELTTTNLVVHETLTLLRYRLGWEAARSFGEAVRRTRMTRQVAVTPVDEDQGWAIFLRYRDHRLSFTDCTSFAVMRRLKLDVAVTLDDDFRSFGLTCMP